MKIGSVKYISLLNKMEELHLAKSAGYSGDNEDCWANFRMSENFGVSAFLGCLIRITDKFIRIQNLVKNPSNDMVGESVRDTLFDLASYALIAICLWDESVEQNRQLEKLKDWERT